MVLTVNARGELCQASRSRGVGGGEGRAPTSGRGGDCDEDDAGRDGSGEVGCEDDVELEDGKVVREDVASEVVGVLRSYADEAVITVNRCC